MRNVYLKAGLIIGILMMIFSAASAAIGGGFQILEHNSSSSLDGQTIWVKANSTTPFSITFNNNGASLNNITQIRFWTSGTNMLLNNVTCPADWVKSSEGDDVKCLANTSVLEPGNTIEINATIHADAVLFTKQTVWMWFTTDDNASYTDNGNFSLGIDLTPPELIITSPAEDSLNQGVFQINFSANDTEVALDLDSIVLQTNCSTGALSYTNDTSDCNAEKSFCNITISIDSNVNIDDGYCLFNVSINDTLQNKGVAEINFTIDNNAPAIVLIAPANNSAINSGTILNFSVTDTVAIDQVWYSNDGGLTNISSSTPYNIDTTGWTEQNTTVIVWANDTIGNLAQETYLFIIDDSGPNVAITAPVDNAIVYKGANLLVKANVSDNGAGINANARCRVTLNGAFAGNIDYYPSDDECRGTISIPSSYATGIYLLDVSINDSINNSNSDSINIDIRNKPSGGGGGVFMPATRINQPPSVSEPRVSPEAPFENDTLTCVSGRYADPEGIEMDSQEWRWYVNGQQISEDSQTLKLESISAKPGDEIICEQRVSDGERYSNWINSSNKAIVQEREPEPVEIIEAPVVEQVQEEQPTTGGITGAFIGALGESGIGGTIIFLGILSSLGTYAFFRYSGKRPRRFILR